MENTISFPKNMTLGAIQNDEFLIFGTLERKELELKIQTQKQRKILQFLKI